MDDLDNILNESEQPVEAVEPQQEPETAEQLEQPRGPDGKFAPKGETVDAPPASDEKARGQEAAIVAERRKRQELEAKLADMERQIAAKQEPPAPPPSIWEDDQAALGHVHNSAVSTAVQQATFNAKLDMSEMMARQAYSDFDDVKSEFVRMMQENPALQQQALTDPHPWQRAYQIAKNARTMQELGATNLDELKAALIEQIKAEQAQQPTATNTIPRSLADAQSARGVATQAPAALTMEQILGM